MVYLSDLVNSKCMFYTYCIAEVSIKGFLSFNLVDLMIGQITKAQKNVAA